jgi:type II secretory pathway component PulL
MLPRAIRKWMAFGSGVGIEIGPADLQVSVVRMRPSGATVLGVETIENFRGRPAAEWGRQYAEFVKKHGAGHVAAVVLVPRQEVIVRTVAFPGVKDAELGAAVGYQLDTLHPYEEDDAVLAWARLDTVHVLVGVVRRKVFEQYMAAFSEAGVKVASFTFSAAAIRPAIRMVDDPPVNLLSGQGTADGFEVYGESEARPVYSAVFDMEPGRAFAFAAAELRLPAGTEPVELGIGLSQAAAMTSACPGLALEANLLPEEQRKSSSRLRYVPTAVLAVVLAGLCTAILAHKPYDEGVYREALEAELRTTEPLSSRVGNLDKNIEKTQKRVALLDEFRKRTRADLDLMLELTGTFPPPAYLSQLDMTRENVTVTGETEQAAPLLRVLDGSARLAGSEFITPIGRLAASEVFRIRSLRETAVAVPAQAPAGTGKP